MTGNKSERELICYNKNQCTGLLLETFMKKLIISLTLCLPSIVLAAGCNIPTKRMDWEDKFCKQGTNCILEWKGYGWWTNFHANPIGYFFESNQAYDPRNVTVESGRLKLEIKQSNLGGGLDWTAAEAVLVSQGGQPVNIGYGQYLVTIETPVPILEVDPGTVFGAFTYDRKQENGQDVQASPAENNLNELDVIELSKWGWNGEGNCPFTGAMVTYGCSGIAQLGSQPWAQPNNLVRFSMPEKFKESNTLTFFMDWTKEGVKYKVFNGQVDPQTAANTEGDIYNWSLPNKQFIPSADDGCIRFHLNFYRPVYSPDAANITKIPTMGKNYIYVLNFNYTPAQ